jgi:calcineurin-like phosphoesterase family protein
VTQQVVDFSQEQLTKLYIEYLSEFVTYGDKAPRPRVRYIKQWQDNTESVINNPDGPVDLFADPDRKVFIWSDHHFGHKNIIRFSDRPYPDLELMNHCLIGNNNKVVDDNDICIWGGDIGFMNDKFINEYLDQCKGYKILIIGNHDFNKKKLRNLNFDEIHMTYHFNRYNIDFAISHYPMNNLPAEVINIHGHMHGEIYNSPQHLNICVEHTNYHPMLLNDVTWNGKMRHEEIIG